MPKVITVQGDDPILPGKGRRSTGAPLRSPSVTLLDRPMTETLPDPIPDSVKDAAPPPGFHHLPIPMGFVAVNGPLFVNVSGDKLKLGMRVEMRHCNPMQICHGGMLATFIDMLMPFAVGWEGPQEGRFMPTVQLSQDYLAPAPLGCWLEGEAQVLRRTNSLVYAQCLVTADGETCLRASGIFKLTKPIPGHMGVRPFLESLAAKGPTAKDQPG